MSFADRASTRVGSSAVLSAPAFLDITCSSSIWGRGGTQRETGHLSPSSSAVAKAKKKRWRRSLGTNLQSRISKGVAGPLIELLRWHRGVRGVRERWAGAWRRCTGHHPSYLTIKDGTPPEGGFLVGCCCCCCLEKRRHHEIQDETQKPRRNLS